MGSTRNTRAALKNTAAVNSIAAEMAGARGLAVSVIALPLRRITSTAVPGACARTRAD